MFEKAPNQASSKEDLDQLSALEESMASFGMGDLDSEHGVILKDWSAQDFANIYVRFRPHLISHARKFLREETQAEEVVQDAFLYLMTALPELDSELGVLRFLKWKTKMLCLDIIRSSQAGLNNNLVPLPDDIADETQPLDSLERADDAAIIRLALAKLNPRHREALIATMYEEKSHEEAAQQMGVGENAFRQLLFRARASFRQALVGEADVKGKSASEILSVAVKKSTSRITLALLLLMGAAPIAWDFSQSSNVVSAPAVIPQYAVPGPDVGSNLPKLDREPGGFSQSQESALSGPRDNTWPEDQSVLATPADFEQSLGVPQEELASSPLSTNTNVVETGISLAAAKGIEQAQLLLDQTFLGRLTADVVEEAEVTRSEDFQQLKLKTNQGVKATFMLSNDLKQELEFAWFEMEFEEHILALVPQSITHVKREVNVGHVCSTVLFADFVVGDVGGSLGSVAFSDGLMSRNAALLEVCLTNEGQISHSSLIFSNRQ